jgi:signal peptidase I
MQATANRRKQTKRVGGERRAGDSTRIADALKHRGRIALRVQGTSMLPWVRPQDIALIRKTTMENVRCGDIVLFRRDDHLFVHRIVKKKGSLESTQFWAKGDAHPTADGMLVEQELLGRVVRIYRQGRRIDLEAPGQLALGLFISQLSLHSRFWYPVARFVAIVTRPARRLLHVLHVSLASVR